MARIIVKDIPPYDGDYELDSERTFNTHEWRWIKEVSGYMPLTVDDGFAGGDPSLFVALAVICMHRAGKVEKGRVLEVADSLADAPFDGRSISMVGDAVEEDTEIPLDLTNTPGGSSPTGSYSSSESKRESEKPSGTSSPRGSVPLGVTPSVTSLLRSGTS